jgi:hypothetical protein
MYSFENSYPQETKEYRVMEVTTFLTITYGPEEIEKTIEITGEFERHGSSDPNARGYHLADWWTDPKDIILTKEQQEEAVQALYDERAACL